MEEPEQERTLQYKLKALAVLEGVCFLISLVVPVTPSKTGKPFHWPATWDDYFADVFLSFLLVNAVLIVIFVIVWVSVKRMKDQAPSDTQRNES